MMWVLKNVWNIFTLTQTRLTNTLINYLYSYQYTKDEKGYQQRHI